MNSFSSLVKNFHFTSAPITTKGAVTGFLYGFMVYLSTRFVFPVTDLPIIWSANAFPAAILLFNRSRQWPALLLSCAIGLLCAGLPQSLYLEPTYILICALNLLQITLLATVIRKVMGTIPTRRKRNKTIITTMWTTALVIIAMSAVSILIFEQFYPQINFLSAFFRISTSAYLGQFLLLSATIYWVIWHRISLKHTPLRDILEYTFVITTLFIIMVATWAKLDLHTPVHFIFPYMTFPLLVWSAIRFGVRMTLTCSIITSLFTKYIASLGYIADNSTDFSSYNDITGMNIGLIALYGTILILAIIVSDQKQIKHDLTKREEWFQIAIDHMSGGLYLLDQERRFKVLSVGLQRKFRLPSKICHVGAHIEPVLRFRAERGDFGPGNPEDLIKERMIALENPETQQGRNHPPSGRAYEYFQNHTKDNEIIVLYHEITERIKAEKDSEKALQEAQHANKAKTDFLANMSHELRTPLNAIIGFSEMLDNNEFVTTYPEKVREYSKDIHMSGCHLLQIINDILDLSKIEAGMADIDPEEIYLFESIKECVVFIELRADTAGISLINDIEDDDTTLFADPRMFKQIMVNILSNSVKFTPKGGSIHITYHINAEGGTTVNVKDTGIGIEESEIEAMMEPFRQADSSLSREFEGTGLGLPLAKSLLELHGGTISIKSDVGVGTTVSITFPKVSDDAENTENATDYLIAQQ